MIDNQLLQNVLLFSCNLIGQFCLGGLGYSSWNVRMIKVTITLNRNLLQKKKETTVIEYRKPSLNGSYQIKLDCWSQKGIFSPLKVTMQTIILDTANHCDLDVLELPKIMKKKIQNNCLDMISNSQI